MPVIQYIMPSKNKQLKKLLHFYWEVCPKYDESGKLKQEMILVVYVYFFLLSLDTDILDPQQRHPQRPCKSCSSTHLPRIHSFSNLSNIPMNISAVQHFVSCKKYHGTLSFSNRLSLPSEPTSSTDTPMSVALLFSHCTLSTANTLLLYRMPQNSCKHSSLPNQMPRVDAMHSSSSPTLHYLVRWSG